MTNLHPAERMAREYQKWGTRLTPGQLRSALQWMIGGHKASGRVLGGCIGKLRQVAAPDGLSLPARDCAPNHHKAVVHWGLADRPPEVGRIDHKARCPGRIHAIVPSKQDG